MAQFTKQAIRATFLELLAKKPFDRITVKDIVETCKINRNTFYYYYEDIYKLLEAVLWEDIGAPLTEPRETAGFCQDYIQAAFCMSKYHRAVMHIYNSDGREILRDYLEKVTRKIVKSYVVEAAEGCAVSELGIRYITDFYSYAFVGNTLAWVRDGMPPYRDKIIKKIAESFEATLGAMIKDWVERGVESDTDSF